MTIVAQEASSASSTGQPVSDGAGGLDPAAACCLALLEQTAAFIEQLDAALYARPCGEFFGGAIGQHVRHLLDHIEAAAGAIHGPGVIDYDHRVRGTPIETDPAAALTLIDRLRTTLAHATPSHAARPVRVVVLLAADDDDTELHSTLARELAFAAHHAIHHHAMIASIAGRFGMPVPPGFGMAPATVRGR